MLTFYVVGLIVTAALMLWYIFDYYGGFTPIHIAVKNNPEGTGSSSPLFVFLVLLLASLLLNAISWPLILILLLIDLNKRYKTTGQFKILVPNIPK